MITFITIIMVCTNMILARVIFYGKVQGVYFRVNTQFKARELGLVGTVRNLDDGKVEAFIQGDEGSVMELIRWCCEDQAQAKVTRKDVEVLGSTEDFKDFIIIR